MFVAIGKQDRGEEKREQKIVKEERIKEGKRERDGQTDR
jgi:hypothetical protein